MGCKKHRVQLIQISQPRHGPESLKSSHFMGNCCCKPSLITIISGVMDYYHYYHNKLITITAVVIGVMSQLMGCPKVIGVAPNHPSHSWLFCIESHGDLGYPHFRTPPVYSPWLTIINHHQPSWTSPNPRKHSYSWGWGACCLWHRFKK